MNEQFSAALAAMDAGDISALKKLLLAHPDLVKARAESDDPLYKGYFHGATLLHHVANNPIRGELPKNVAKVAQTLIDAGADVDAQCGGGPDQPDTAGGTTLGLVASGGLAAVQGLSESLIDTLARGGAKIDGDPGIMWLALYHTVECKKQRDVAEMLYKRGAKVDLCFAAGLGKIDVIKRFFTAEGGLTPDAYSCERPPGDKMDDPSDAEILQEALAYACMNGRVEAVKFLHAKGAKLNETARVARMEVTPLHCAAWAGWVDVAQFLVGQGADVNRLDPTHGSSPIGWAAYCKRMDVLDLLLSDESKLDLLSAAEFGRLGRLKALLRKKDPDQAVGPGDRGVLLRMAAYHGHYDMVVYLLECGADPNLINTDGKSAVHYAAQQNHNEIVERLRRHRSTR